MPLTNNSMVPPAFYRKGMERENHCGASAGRIVLKKLKWLEFNEQQFSRKLMKPMKSSPTRRSELTMTGMVNQLLQGGASKVLTLAASVISLKPFSVAQLPLLSVSPRKAPTYRPA